MKPYQPDQKAFARELRSHQTDAEQRLWHHLRRKQLLGLQFYRQKPIGPYIADFYCAAARLVIELDGGQHFEPAHQAKDQQRDNYLSQLGLLVLRFDNLQALKETEAVLQMIHQTLETRIPPTPLLQRGERPTATVPTAKDTPSTPSFSKDTPSTPSFAKDASPPPPFAKGGPGGISNSPEGEQ